MRHRAGNLVTRDLPASRRWRARAMMAGLSVPVLSACQGVQSALSPGGRDAAEILDLGVALFLGAAIIFVGVMALTVWAVVARPDRFPGARAWVIGGGAVFPIVVLSVLQVYEFALARGLVTPSGERPLRIDMRGLMWWWEVRYPGEEPYSGAPFATANELVIPVGRPVEVVVTTADVIHSVWVPGLAGKQDMIPGHVNRLTLRADRPGIYRGQCAEFCGAQHALMAFYVVAEPPDRFERWLERQRSPAPAPENALLAGGRSAFLRYGCGACHTVRGTPAAGTVGPDLTHVGGRLSLAAGTLPNTAGAFADWITASQHLKPENGMPSFDVMDGDTARAIALWLESLE